MENGPRGEEDLKIQVKRKMYLLIRSLMHLIKDVGLSLQRNIIKLVPGNLSSVGFVVNTITMIVHYNRVANHRSRVLKRHKLLGT